MPETDDTISRVSIFDVVGKIVINSTGVSGSQFTADITGISKGLYLVEIETSSGRRLVKKLLKE